ncbi:MAG TPA: hypothetical protein PKA64_08970, partial [Myxococcota bacterium]|nr:hypothetical protein [Myxococcota bacterium]
HSPVRFPWYRWRAHRFQGNRTGEWLVGYEDERGFGFHYVVDTTTGTVSDPDQDPFIAHRVGLLAEPANPFVKLEGVKAGLVRCSSGKVAGWCFEAQGVALNAGDPITFLDVEALVALRLGDRVYDGENRPQQPDPFSSVSQSRPWPSGERRSFHYKSRILPETLAESRGELLANLRITTETLSRARTAEYGLVQKISWNPDNLPE